MDGKFLFLGTGGSMGVPVIGCSCSVCRSPSDRNKRLRSAGLLKIGSKTLLIDVGPDFRQQALKFQIKHLDGILLTHCHFDHIGGLDDLRVFYFIQKKALPCLLSKEMMEDLKVRYDYLMQPLSKGKSVYTQLDFQVLEGDFGLTHFEGIPIQYLSYTQAGIKVNGFRVGSFAYVSDIREYSETIFDALKGVEVLVLSSLALLPSRMHFSVEEAIAFANRVGASMTYLTHAAHELDYEEVSRDLPSQVRLSYDGLEISFK